MINFRKGQAYSLLQTDYIAAIPSGNTAGTFIAGMIATVNASGVVALAATTTTTLNGFLINNDTDGDVLASGNIGLIMLDGDTVVETDQAASTINATNYPIGSLVYGNSSGLVATSGTRSIGQVYSIRTIPAPANVTVSGFNTAGTAGTQAVQSTVTVLGIKLSA